MTKLTVSPIELLPGDLIIGRCDFRGNYCYSSDYYALGVDDTILVIQRLSSVNTACEVGSKVLCLIQQRLERCNLYCEHYVILRLKTTC